ncbi:hypothetical protein ABZ413_08775 [Nocardia rhamnosiphila]|uniref:hypothetical protein n=1 Tax=Nocardia rhamnosiphila TaxID=426716 RepID=UPI0033D1564F
MSGNAGSTLLASVTRRLAMGLNETAGRLVQSFGQFYRTTSDLMRDGAHMIEHRDGIHVLWEIPPDGLGTRPGKPVTSRYRPSVAEATMSGRRWDRDEAFDPEMLEHVREAASASIRKMRSTDGGTNIYKSEAGENYDGLFHFRPYRGAQTDREVAAYRLDEALGFGRIPPTARTNGVGGPDPHYTGPGMIQQFVESRPAEVITRYQKRQQQQVAVLDYIMGNLDRRPANFRTVDRGNGTVDLLAIDHGRAFPESFDSLAVPMKSDFLAEWAREGKDLDPDVLAAVDRVDVDRLRVALLDAGLSENATTGALHRLEHLRALRKVPPYIAHG